MDRIILTDFLKNRGAVKMFTCKIKVGTEWNLPASIKRQDKANKWRTIKGRKMNDIKAIKEILKSLKGQYKTITQEEEGEYTVIKAY